MSSDRPPADRTRDLVQRALSLVGRERTDFLATSCGEDSELRAEVDALIAELGASAPIDLEPDEQVGPYRLLEMLGEGGFGRVYLAEQRDPVRRRVALKVIKLGMDTRQLIARFEAERQALSMMSHPNIAQVLDVGSTDRGRPYFVMELVRGVSITEYCRRHDLDLRARIELFITVCGALQHAHQKGVIHRDVKPSNVLVSVESGRPMAKVIDFGIAKATHSGLTDKTLVTLRQQVIGTPVYMPPEQAERSGLDVDTRSDIYALGALLYQLVTGTPPFDRAELEPLGQTEMLRVIREVDPPRPSERVADESHAEAPAERDLAARLRGDIDWIVMRCLEKDRTRRYETASELAAELQRHLDDEPVLAGPPSAAYRVGKFVRRNRTTVAAAGVALGLLIVAVVGTTLGLLWALEERERADDAAHAASTAQATAQRHEREAREALARARAETERADEATEHAEEQASLAQDARAQSRRRADELERILGVYRSQFEELDRAALALRLRDALHAVADSRGAAESATFHELLQGVSFGDLALGVVSQGVLDTALDGAREEFADHPLLQARLERAVAQGYAHIGMHAEAEGPQRACLATLRAELGEEHPETLAALHELGDILVRGLQLEPGLEVLERCLALRTALHGGESREALATQASRAVALRQLGRLARCHELQAACVETLGRRFGPTDRATLLALEQLAQTLFLMGEFDASAEAAQRAVDGFRSAHPERHEDIWRTKNTLALAIKVQGNLGAARALLEEVRAGTQALLGSRHRLSLMATLNLGGLLMEQGRLDEADALVQPVVETYETLHGRDHTYSLEARLKLGELRIEQGRGDEGCAILHDAWVRMGRYHGDEAHPEALDIGATLARQQLYAGDPLDAAAVVVQLGHTVTRELQPEDGRRERVLSLVHGLVRALEGSFPEDGSTDALLAWLDAASAANNVLGRFDEAEALLRHGLDTAGSDASVPAWRRAELRGLLGEASAGLRRFDEARTLLLDSHRALETEPPSRATSRRLERSARRLARFHADVRDDAGRRTWSARALELQARDG